MKTNWNRLKTFYIVATNYLAKNPQDTKPKFFIERVLAQLPALREEVELRLSEIDIDHCSVDERENISRDAQGNLQFTKEQMKLRNQKTAKLLASDELEIEPYFCSFPQGLTAQEEDAFEGLVLKAKTKVAS